MKYLKELNEELFSFLISKEKKLKDLEEISTKAKDPKVKGFAHELLLVYKDLHEKKSSAPDKNKFMKQISIRAQKIRFEAASYKSKQNFWSSMEAEDNKALQLVIRYTYSLIKYF